VVVSETNASGCAFACIAGVMPMTTNATASAKSATGTATSGKSAAMKSSATMTAVCFTPPFYACGSTNTRRASSDRSTSGG